MSIKIKHKIIKGIEHKWCSKCKQWLPLCNFCKNKENSDSLECRCKACKMIYNKQYRKNNKTKIAIQRKKYRQNNKEKIIICEKQYIKANQEKVDERHRKYRQNNKEKINAYNKQYSIVNREKRLLYHKQYKQSPASYTYYVNKICQYEQTRHCPINSNFLEVKCAYCGNWFKPTNIQIQSRIRAINGDTDGEQRLYCSNNCKLACPIYRQRIYPKGFKQATSREVIPLLRQLVLKRDNYTCQMCGATTETAQLHVHHIISYAQNKMQANDPDSCITLCKECHKKVHKQNGCKYNDLRCKNK